MHSTDYQEPGFPIKWIVIPAAVLVLSVIPALAFMGPSKGSLTGTVTFQGKPVTTGHVVAFAHDGSMHSATLDSQGKYELQKVPTGKVQLGVVSRDPAKTMLRQQKMAHASDRLPEEDRTAGRSAITGKWIPLPVQYEDPRSSALEASIKGSTEFHIELR